MRFRGLQNLPFPPYRFEHLVVLFLIRLMNKRCCGAMYTFTSLVSKISDGRFFVEEEKKLAMIFGEELDLGVFRKKVLATCVPLCSKFGANQATQNQTLRQRVLATCVPLCAKFRADQATQK
ncbi:unnamed protein product [Brassica rapa subsp. narinosa]